MTDKQLTISKIMEMVEHEVKKREPLPEHLRHITTLEDRKQRLAQKEDLAEEENDISLANLLKHEDKAFIISAYKAILNRSPDSAGLQHHLQLLQKGHVTKIEIIGNLRFSREGREEGVKIEGILLPFLRDKSYKVPFLGRLFKYVYLMLTFPKQVTQINQRLNQLAHEIEQLDGAQEAMHRKFDRELTLIKRDARQGPLNKQESNGT